MLKVCTITITLVLVGCSSSLLVTPTGQSGDLSFNKLNEQIKNDKVTISFEDSGRAIAEEFRLENDSASWKEVVSGSMFKTSVSRLHFLSTHPNRFVGAMNGLGKGLVIGGVIGAMIGGGSDSFRGDEGMGAFLGALTGGGAGALIGIVLGAVVPQSHEYHFTHTALKK